MSIIQTKSCFVIFRLGWNSVLTAAVWWTVVSWTTGMSSPGSHSTMVPYSGFAAFPMWMGVTIASGAIGVTQRRLPARIQVLDRLGRWGIWGLVGICFVLQGQAREEWYLFYSLGVVTTAAAGLNVVDAYLRSQPRPVPAYVPPWRVVRSGLWGIAGISGVFLPSALLTETLAVETALAIVPGIVLSVVAVYVYFIPAIAARVRKHEHRIAVSVLNLVLGSTVIGWFSAFHWATADTT